MLLQENEIIKRLSSLSESFALEVKSWFSILNEEGQAKLIKAVMALKNNNGGMLVIGFNNDTMQPDPYLTTLSEKDIKKQFRQDKIQKILGKYLSEQFEVNVDLIPFQDKIHPVISVPPGVRTPIAAKKPLVSKDSTGKETHLVKKDEVYVRTLNSNNSVSTSSAKWQDWPKIIQICFDNREADIGAFVRRHLNIKNIPDIIKAFAEIPQQVGIKNLLDQGFISFTEILKKRNLLLPQAAYFEIAAKIDGNIKPNIKTNKIFLNLINSSNKHLTGWPFFVVLNYTPDFLKKPEIKNDAWVQSVINCDEDMQVVEADFWQIKPDGSFYQIRLHQPARRHNGTTILDAIYAENEIITLTDALLETLAISSNMVENLDIAEIEVIVRWRGLQGKRLISSQLDSPLWGYVNQQTSASNEVVSTLKMPINISDSAIASQAALLLETFFNIFDGLEISEESIGTIIKRGLKLNSNI